MAGVSLPNELLGHIFMQVRLAPEDSWDEQTKLSTLCNISQSSRTFNELCMPALYHTISIKTFDSTPTSFFACAGKKLHVLQWVHNVNFVFMGEWTSTPEQCHVPSVISKDFRGPLMEACSCSDLAESVLTGLDHDHLDAQISTVLLLCPMLSTLSIPASINHIKSDGVLHKVKFTRTLAHRVFMDACSSTERSHLTRLRTVVLGRGHFMQRKFFDYGAILSLPSLQNFVGISVSHRPPSRSFPRPVLASNIRSLSLNESGLGVDGLEPVLKIFPRLQHFALELASSGSDGYPGLVSSIDFDSIAEALCREGYTIKSFILRTRRLNDRALPQSPPLSGSLREMTALQHLTLPAWVLFGFRPTTLSSSPLDLRSILPYSVLSVCIVDALTERDRESLESLVGDLTEDSRFTGLSKITVGAGPGLLEEPERFEERHGIDLEEAFTRMSHDYIIDWVKDNESRWTRHEHHCIGTS